MGVHLIFVKHSDEKPYYQLELLIRHAQALGCLNPSGSGDT